MKVRVHADMRCFQNTGRPAEISALRHAVRLCNVALSLAGKNTDTKQTLNEKKKKTGKDRQQKLQSEQTNMQ
jgi:hypothetical protein